MKVIIKKRETTFSIEISEVQSAPSSINYPGMLYNCRVCKNGEHLASRRGSTEAEVRLLALSILSKEFIDTVLESKQTDS